MSEGVPNLPLCPKNYFELKIFEKQQMQEEAFLWTFPYLPKSRASQKNSNVINSLLGVSQAEKMDSSHLGQGPEFTEKDLITILSLLPSILLRAHLSFLKAVCFPLSALSSLPLLRWYIISDNGIISKELIQLNSKKEKKKIQFKNGQKNWVEIFPKETYRWPKGTQEGAWTSVRYHFTPVRMAVMCTNDWCMLMNVRNRCSIVKPLSFY